MHCTKRCEWLRNILGAQSRSKECSKVVGFSLLELFGLHNPPTPPHPLLIAFFFSLLLLSLSFFHFAQKISQNTHTHAHMRTHTISATWQLSREGLQCRSLSKSSLLAVLLMLTHQQQWSSRNAEHPALIKKKMSLILHTVLLLVKLHPIQRASWSQDITPNNTGFCPYTVAQVNMLQSWLDNKRLHFL